jgi:hypothetical protein
MTTNSSLLLFCVKDAPAIMMATHAKPKLQLIVAFIRTLSAAHTNFDLISVIVEFNSTPCSKGAQFALATLQTFVDKDQAALQSVATKLIVEYSKISFHFCKDCRIFCEGVKGTISISSNSGSVCPSGHNFASGVAFDHNLAFSLILAFGLFSFGKRSIVCHRLLGFICCVGYTSVFVSPSKLIVICIGLRLVSLISLIGFCFIGINNHIGLNSVVSLIGFISLIGGISFGLIASSASAVLLAHRPCDFAAATHQFGPVGCTSPSSFNGISGLISQVGLVNLGGISIVGLVDLGSISLVSLMGLIGGHINHGLGLVGLITMMLLALSTKWNLKSHVTRL